MFLSKKVNLIDVLDKFYNTLDIPTEVYKDVKFIDKEIEFEGFTITSEIFTSSNILSTTGAVKALEEDDCNVEVIYKLSIGSISKKYTFNVKVLSYKSQCEMAFKNVIIPDRVIENINLPKSFENVTIEWTSNKPKVLSNAGIYQYQSVDTEILKQKITLRSEQLVSLSPKGILKRGYSITLDASGKPITDASTQKIGNKIKTIYYEGESVSTIDEIKGE